LQDFRVARIEPTQQLRKAIHLGWSAR
jgi:hypothetical protein